MAEVRERKSEGEGEVSAVTAPSKFPLTTNEVVLAVAIVGASLIGLACVLLTMPETDGSEVFKIPKTLDDLKLLRNFLERYARDYKSQVVLGYSFVYIFMQTFMIPGTVFMSLLGGSLFGVSKGVALVVFNATVGASCCFFLSKMIGKPLANLLWPSKIIFFQEQVAKRKENLLNYMLFLRVTPTLPNTFINVASPIVDVPYHTFFLATFLGLIPAAFLTVRAGITLCQLRSLADLYDFQALATLFVIGIISVTPALLNKTDKKAPA